MLHARPRACAVADRRPLPPPPLLRAAGMSLLLAVVMFNRYRKSGKVMPAGAVAGCSALMSIAYMASGL
jgi:hypothetical protein